MNILIFSDLHGKVIHPFLLARQVELDRNIRIDYILNCGDTGIFPDASKLDRATLKHSKLDDSETGFSRHLVKYQPEIEQLLNSVECTMICVRGNHEDHTFLDDLEKKSNESIFAVDFYRKIFLIKTGEIVSLTRESETVRIMGIGRVGSPDNKKSLRYLQPYERDKLIHLPKNSGFDILISHDSPIDFVTHGYGMQEIRDILNSHEPLFHFFGHTGTPFTIRIDENGFTTSVKVAEFRLNKDNTLSNGAVLLLRWNGYGDNSLEAINQGYRIYSL